QEFHAVILGDAFRDPVVVGVATDARQHVRQFMEQRARAVLADPAAAAVEEKGVWTRESAAPQRIVAADHQHFLRRYLEGFLDFGPYEADEREVTHLVDTR